MIAHHYGNFGFEFSGLLALQKVLKAMRQARREQGNFWDVVAEMEFKLHSELLSQGTELRGDLVPESGTRHNGTRNGPGRLRFDVGILIRLQDVAARAGR